MMSCRLRRGLWLLVGIGGVGCGADSAPAPSTAAQTPAVSSPEEPKPSVAVVEPEAPGVRADGTITSAVSWFHGSLEQALAQASQENKLVFMDVGAYWCPPCRRLDEEVFVQPKVAQRLAADFVAVHIDAEKGEGPELVDRYKVQAFPTMVVLEASGVEKSRIVDFMPADALLESLDTIAKGGNVLTGLADEVRHDPDDLHKRYALAHAYLLAADAESAQPHLEAVLLGDPKGELGLASQVLYDRALFVTHKLEGNAELAIEQLRDLQRRWADSKEAVRAYRHIGRLLHMLGRDDEAIASLEAMVATNPDDPALAASFGWFAFRQHCGQSQGLAAVRHGLEKAKDDAQLHYLQAELLHQLNHNDEALVSIRKASELEPHTAFYRRQVKRFESLIEEPAR